MSLTDYVARLQALVAATPFVTATSFSYDERPPSAGFIKGTIHFVDGSQPDFKEFLITQPTLRVIKYGYITAHNKRNMMIHQNRSGSGLRG